MAASDRRKTDTLEKSLQTEPDAYAFFQLVRLIQLLAPGKGPAGRDTPPAKEAVRLRGSITLGFPDREIEDAHAADHKSQKDVTVAFGSLTGSAGVLPNHYTDLIILQSRLRNPAMHAFLDALSHRSLSLLYRAWEKYRLAFRYENWAVGREPRDQFVDTLYAFAGLAPDGLRDRMGISDGAIVQYAGLTARRHRPGAALGPLLSEVFGIQIQIEPLVGTWLRLPVAEQTRAGARAANHAQLGVDAVLGGAIWDIQSQFRITAGPLTYRQFKDLLPDGKSFGRFCDLVRFYVGTEFDFDVNLMLEARDVPPCRIASQHDDVRRLGWDSWIGSVAENTKVNDTRLKPQALQ